MSFNVVFARLPRCCGCLWQVLKRIRDAIKTKIESWISDKEDITGVEIPPFKVGV